MVCLLYPFSLLCHTDLMNVKTCRQAGVKDFRIFTVMETHVNKHTEKPHQYCFNKNNLRGARLKKIYFPGESIICNNKLFIQSYTEYTVIYKGSQVSECHNKQAAKVS